MQELQRQLSSPPGGASVSPASPFSKHAGWLSLAAGSLFVAAQSVMWTFDQMLNLETSLHPVFQAAKVGYLVGFIVLMFALVAAHGWQADKAGRLGTVAASTAIVGTMMLAGDLWFESFVVPWLAGGPAPHALTSAPSTLFGLGAIASYLLFAAGWTLFGIAGLRARVFPVAISALIVIGGVAGYNALLAPGGIPLGVALMVLGGWMLASARKSAHSPAEMMRPQ